MPDSLDSWLPKDPTEFTRVFEPLVIDQSATVDLMPYHPTASNVRPCNFRLIRVPNEAVATVDIVNPQNWDRDFATVLRSLRLRVVNEGKPDEHLLDDVVSAAAARPMSGWKVVSWTIKRTGFDGHFDPPEVTTLTDRIVWERVDGSGTRAVSSYNWRPYKK